MAGRKEEIAGFQFRLGTVLALRSGLQWFFVWTMIWATAAVLLRIFLADRSADFAVGGIGLLPAAVVASGPPGDTCRRPPQYGPCWTATARWAGW